jgi:hypothetical protein
MWPVEREARLVEIEFPIRQQLEIGQALAQRKKPETAAPPAEGTKRYSADPDRTKRLPVEPPVPSRSPSALPPGA